MDLRLRERKCEWVDEHPLLVIYCIDKDSKPRNKSSANIVELGKGSGKVALESEEDIISFLIEVPNIETRDADMVQIELDPEHLDSEDEL